MIKRISIIASFSVAALAAPAALGLNLDIWGVAHMSVDGADNGQESDTYIASNSSRLAVSGDQGVTDNLKIVFQYESGVDLTGRGENDGNGGCGADGEACQGQLFTRTRDAFVGLSGGFGKLLAEH